MGGKTVEDYDRESRTNNPDEVCNDVHLPKLRELALALGPALALVGAGEPLTTKLT